MKVSGTYVSWCNMIQRCTNPRHPKYRDYGGRGITVCEAWRQSYTLFLLDMGERPLGQSLDRIDNDKGYSPDNCRWATPAQQANNQRVKQSNTSGVVDVYFDNRQQKWKARYQRVHIGSFNSFEEACVAQKRYIETGVRSLQSHGPKPKWLRQLNTSSQSWGGCK